MKPPVRVIPCLCALLCAQVPLEPVPPLNPTSPTECVSLDQRWSNRYRSLSESFHAREKALIDNCTWNADCILKNQCKNCWPIKSACGDAFVQMEANRGLGIEVECARRKWATQVAACRETVSQHQEQERVERARIEEEKARRERERTDQEQARSRPVAANSGQRSHSRGSEAEQTRSTTASRTGVDSLPASPHTLQMEMQRDNYRQAAALQELRRQQAEFLADSYRERARRAAAEFFEPEKRQIALRRIDEMRSLAENQLVALRSRDAAPSAHSYTLQGLLNTKLSDLLWQQSRSDRPQGGISETPAAFGSETLKSITSNEYWKTATGAAAPEEYLRLTAQAADWAKQQVPGDASRISAFMFTQASETATNLHADLIGRLDHAFERGSPDQLQIDYGLITDHVPLLRDLKERAMRVEAGFLAAKRLLDIGP